MESTSEVAYKEQTASLVSTKCAKEMTASTVQQISSSFVGEESAVSILVSDGILPDGKQIITFPSVESPISSPITSGHTLPEGDNGMNLTSVQSEFSAMTLKNNYGEKIGEIVEQKQDLSSTTSLGTKSSASLSQVSSLTTASSRLHESAKTVVTKSKESSTSTQSCSSYNSTRKQEILSSTTKSFSSSTKSSQSIDMLASSTAVADSHEF